MWALVFLTASVTMSLTQYLPSRRWLTVREQCLVQRNGFLIWLLSRCLVNMAKPRLSSLIQRQNDKVNKNGKCEIETETQNTNVYVATMQNHTWRRLPSTMSIRSYWERKRRVDYSHLQVTERAPDEQWKQQVLTRKGKTCVHGRAPPSPCC